MCPILVLMKFQNFLESGMASYIWTIIFLFIYGRPVLFRILLRPAFFLYMLDNSSSLIEIIVIVTSELGATW